LSAIIHDWKPHQTLARRGATTTSGSILARRHATRAGRRETIPSFRSLTLAGAKAPPPSSSMKISPRSCCCLLVATTLLLAGCSSSPISRIDGNRAAYESWPLDVQEAVLNGEAKKGMTREQVEMALGKPSQVVARSLNDEVWVYRKGGTGSSLLGNTGLSVGAGLGGVNVGTSSRGGRRTASSSEEREVVFEKGVVVRSDSP
jgi:hypothetical protein